MLGISRKPVADGLRVAGRRLAGQIAVQQEIATLVVGVHAPITGQGRPDPQAYAACRALPRRIIRTPPSAVRGTTPTPPRRPSPGPWAECGRRTSEGWRGRWAASRRSRLATRRW